MSDSRTLNITFREATPNDIPVLAKLRALSWEKEEYWAERITGYFDGTANPWHSKAPRIIYVACAEEKIVGFIAGHLSTRLGCEGELQWIDVIPEYRRQGVASALVRKLAE